jgi:ribosome biogenesis GTPase
VPSPYDEEEEHDLKRHAPKRNKGKKEKARDERLAAEKAVVAPVEPTVAPLPGAETALVAELRYDRLTVSLRGQLLKCSLSASLPPQFHRSLVVGDRVQVVDGEVGRGVVVGVYPRISVVARIRGRASHVIAANVDYGVIVASVKGPEFHPRFIDRYLVVCQNGNVSPLLCISKCDLGAERHEALAVYESIGIPIVLTSSATGMGIEELKAHLAGKTAVLVGHSGVGKSSIINAAIPGYALRANAVNTKTGQGKHTTTGSNLYAWDAESYLIDTPGIRSLGIDDIDKTSLRRIEGWSTRTLRERIDSMLYERTALSKKPDDLIRQELASREEQLAMTLIDRRKTLIEGILMRKAQGAR